MTLKRDLKSLQNEIKALEKKMEKAKHPKLSRNPELQNLPRQKPPRKL